VVDLKKHSKQVCCNPSWNNTIVHTMIML
jgi:hypothetical protein